MNSVQRSQVAAIVSSNIAEQIGVRQWLGRRRGPSGGVNGVSSEVRRICGGVKGV